MPRVFLHAVIWFAAGLAGRAADLPSTASRPVERANPLVYRDPEGGLRQVRTVAEWEQRRGNILAAMQQVMGPLPGREKRCPLAVEVGEESDCGSYLRRRISYAAEPGDRAPAYLLVPKAAMAEPGKAPGVLCLHQTHKLGNKVVAGLGNSIDDEYGVELVQRGYVCLAPAYPLLADYNPNLKALGYQSGTMKAVWNNIRGLDLLASLPWVKNGHFGAIGHSLGGHNGVFTAMFDPRLAVVVSCCGLDSFFDYMNGDIKGWTSDRYMPRLLDYRLAEIPFDFPEVIGALAPRSCLLVAPVGDTNFKWRSVEMIGRAAAGVYELHGVPSHLQLEHPACGHRFPPEMRFLAYEFLDAALLK